MSYVATPAEELEIRKAVVFFDAELKRAETELGKPLPEPIDFVVEVYKAIEEDNLEAIRELQEDTAVLISVRESFPEDGQIQARVSYLIDLERQEIERLREEIINARHRKAEDIRRPGQDHLLF